MNRQDLLRGVREDFSEVFCIAMLGEIDFYQWYESVDATMRADDFCASYCAMVL